MQLVFTHCGNAILTANHATQMQLLKAQNKTRVCSKSVHIFLSHISRGSGHRKSSNWYISSRLSLFTMHNRDFCLTGITNYLPQHPRSLDRVLNFLIVSTSKASGKLFFVFIVRISLYVRRILQLMLEGTENSLTLSVSVLNTNSSVEVYFFPSPESKLCCSWQCALFFCCFVLHASCHVGRIVFFLLFLVLFCTSRKSKFRKSNFVRTQLLVLSARTHNFLPRGSPK